MATSNGKPRLPGDKQRNYSSWGEIPEDVRKEVQFVGEMHATAIPTRFWFRQINTESLSVVVFEHVILDVSQRIEGLVLKREYAWASRVFVSDGTPFLFMPIDEALPPESPKEGGAA